MENIIINNLDEIVKFSFDNSNQSVFFVNESGRLLYANNFALTNLKYTKEEIPKLHIWDIDVNVDTKDKYDKTFKIFEINNNDGKPNILETFHKTKDGEIFPVEVHSKSTKIKEEAVFIFYAREISRRLKRDQEINFYFDLIDSSKDLIFLVNHNTGLIEFGNETACQQLGYRLVEIKGKEIASIKKPIKNYGGLTIPQIFEEVEKKKSLTTFGIYITKSGKEIPVESSLQLREYKGEHFVTAISRDISERLEYELKKDELNKKLKEYNDTLQNEVKKAKTELIEYENIMKRQSKMAAMGEMLENIAHQWRQPLSAVSVLSTGLIIQNEEDVLSKAHLQTSLNKINDQVQYLSKTIDDFRNFFKPNKEKNKFKIQSLIDTSIKLSNAKYDHLVIEFIIDIEDLEIITYENELLQVILNLISNAKDELIKKSYDKYIFVEAKREHENLFLSIKDNAGGIAAHIIDRIFEPYFTTKHNYHGTGIGLYMSENIIRHMSGSIDVKNVEINHNGDVFTGACFDIKIPLY